jgi:carbon storage regulator
VLIRPALDRAGEFGRETVSAGELDRVLVLTRKSGQSIMIGDDVEVRVLAASGDKVRLGIQAPPSVPVHRMEVYLEVRAGEGQSDPSTSGPSPAELADETSDGT